MRMWQQWTSVALGLLLMVVPFLGLSASTITLTMVIVGLIIVAMGLWGAQETTVEREDGRMYYQH